MPDPTLANITDNHTVQVSFTYAGANEQGDWWLFHHDVQHSGRSAATGPGAALQQWTLASGNAIHSSPALAADGTIYIGS